MALHFYIFSQKAYKTAHDLGQTYGGPFVRKRYPASLYRKVARAERWKHSLRISLLAYGGSCEPSLMSGWHQKSDLNHHEMLYDAAMAADSNQ
mmetsp:Transcript_22093/g.28588  ORF Transcript_22093/g.28588 Transcript_22093/m.28588 type:complete len:93 (+) Transcript_22093:697-975(+)